MAKSQNRSPSAQIRVTVSAQSVDLLIRLAQLGIYGRNEAEVAGRFIDTALKEFATAPRFELEQTPTTKRRKK
jgi:hypothetical protein